jgi:hypothetical protein
MSHLSYMRAQRIVSDLFWSALVLAVVLALPHRLRTSRHGWDNPQSAGRVLPDLTDRHQRPT